MDIGKGDWIQCVGPIENPRAPIVIGNIYCVSGFHQARYYCIHCKDHTYLELIGGGDWKYSPCLFRPLKRPPDKKENLLAKITAKEPA